MCYIIAREFLLNQGASMARYPIGSRASTGENCPESGVWKVVGFPTTTAPIAKSNIMPPYAGKAVIWELIEYA